MTSSQGRARFEGSYQQRELAYSDVSPLFQPLQLWLCLASVPCPLPAVPLPAAPPVWKGPRLQAPPETFPCPLQCPLREGTDPRLSLLSTS